jgi:alpha-glucosidase (family GH31 glycosyl hydrolase)
MACCENVQGQTKREGYFPKGKWYNLFDNTTIDAHDEGKSVTLDLPMGHVGVHMPGGTILPLQQAALVTADVRASALTLLVALPHLEPLPAFAATSETPSYNQQTGFNAASSMGQQSNTEEVSVQAQLTLPGAGRKLLTKSDSEAVMRQGRDVEGASPVQECGVSEAGRVTACGHIYMDDGHQLQVTLPLQ